MADQLFPRPPRRMRQPRKEVLREHLAEAATTIEQQRVENERLRAENENLRRQWWRRILRKAA